MNLNEGLAASICAIMKRKHISLSEFAEELGISRTALHDYSKGRGNPSTATIEHIARTLGIAPAVLVTGLADEDRREIILLLLDTVDGIARLSGEKRLRLAELFMEMVQLWDED